MQQNGYPDIAVHKKEHEALAEKVVEFQRDFDAGRVGIGGGRHAVCTPKA